MRLVTSGLVVLLLVAGASCGRPESPVVSVYAYRSADGKRHEFLEPFSQFATWDIGEWTWLPVSEDPFTDLPLDGTLGAWKHDGSLDEALAGVYVAGQRVSGLESLAEFERMKTAVPPLRWSGASHRGSRVGTWHGIGPSGTLEWLVESADVRGYDGADVCERRWPSGRIRVRGRFRMFDAVGDWMAWTEDGILVYRGRRGGPNELPESAGTARLTVAELGEWSRFWLP